MKWAKRRKRHFSEEDMHMTNRCIKRCSVTLTFGKWKLRAGWDITTYRFNRIKNSYSINAGKDEENLGLSYIVSGICTVLQPLWTTAWQVHIKHGHLTVQHSNYTPRHLFQRNEDLQSHKNLYPNYRRRFICNKQKLQKNSNVLIG